MSRVNNWPSVLSAEIERARALPFQWGIHDCCLWPASVALALTERDPAFNWRGKYTTAWSAVKLWRAHSDGLLGLIHDGCAGVGFAPVDVALAKRGDIVAGKQGDFYVGGICIGRQFAGVGVSGLVFNPMCNAVRAWEIK
jgi:hypothetical protein